MCLCRVRSSRAWGARGRVIVDSKPKNTIHSLDYVPLNVGQWLALSLRQEQRRLKALQLPLTGPLFASETRQDAELGIDLALERVLAWLG